MEFISDSPPLGNVDAGAEDPRRLSFVGRRNRPAREKPARAAVFVPDPMLVLKCWRLASCVGIRQAQYAFAILGEDVQHPRLYAICYLLVPVAEQSLQLRIDEQLS